MIDNTNNNTNKKGFLERISSFSLILIMVILIIIGVALVSKIDVSHRPAGKQGDQLGISYSWSGASPRVIEQEVTSKIEGIVSSVNGVESVSSTSNSGSGNVSVKLKKGVNISAVRFEISSILKQISKKLPEGVSYPSLSGGSANSGKSTTKQLLSYQINADMRQDQIQDYAIKNIKPYIEQIKGVENVDISGGVPQYLEITYDPIALSKYGLSASAISAGVSNFLGKSSIVGDVEKIDVNGEKSRITLYLETSKIGTDIAKIPITKVGDKVIYLGSIATMNYKDKNVDSYYRINGLNTIYLSIEVGDDASLISMSEIVRGKMEEVKLNLVDNYYVTLVSDAAKEIKTEINKLIRRTLLSLVILLIFVWLVSRSFRYLSIIAITLVANVFIAVIFYYLLDVQLHIFSLAGIAVSFGIIIDTSIVMVDHYSYYRNRKAFIAILAALITTIGSLVIIFFMPDYIKDELNDFSLIIIINLTVALFISLFFVPAIIDKYNYNSKESRRKISSRRKIVGFSRKYFKYIRFTQKRKWIYITIFILSFGIPVHLLPDRLGDRNWWDRSKPVLKWYEEVYNNTIGSSFYQSTLKKPLEYSLGGTLRLFSSNTSSFSRSYDRGDVTLNIRGQMPEGGTAEQMNQKISQIENMLTKYDEIKRFETRVNGNGGSITVEFKDEFKDGGFPFTLESEVIGEALIIGGADWSTYGVSQRGFSNSLNLTNKNHSISISGYSYDRLFKIAEELTNKMKRNKRVTDVEIQTGGGDSWGDSESGLTEMYVKYDRERVALYNFNLGDGYNALGTILSSSDIGKYEANGVNTDISMVSSERDKFDVWNLFNSYVSVGDKQVKYSLLGEIGQRKARSSIQKKNQEYSISVAFNFMGSYELSDKYVKEVTTELNATLPVGFRSVNDSYGWSDDDGSQYWLILLIVVIIFFICSILFESLIQPLVIISLIPISFIGTFLTFYFSGVTFGTGGFASLVLLSGLVVNAAIYIINEYNNSIKTYDGYSLNKINIYVKSYNHKIIPVLLTIFSTVLGLVPFLMDGVKEQFWFSFAIGTTGGLLFSIIAIIFIMPILMPLKIRK